MKKNWLLIADYWVVYSYILAGFIKWRINKFLQDFVIFIINDVSTPFSSNHESWNWVNNEEELHIIRLGFTQSTF